MKHEFTSKQLRAIDCLVAEHIMGWKNIHHELNNPDRPSFGGSWYGIIPFGEYKNTIGIIPHYHMDISAAWFVFATLAAQGGYGIDTLWDDGPLMRVYRGTWWGEVDETIVDGELIEAPLLICLAALKEKGISLPDI